LPVPRILVSRYFQLVTNRQFTEAERVLERIKQKLEKNEWNKGYFHALKGIMVSKRSNNDQYSLLSNLDINDRKGIREFREEFLGHVNNGLHAEFDRGYFSAWADYMRTILRLQPILKKTMQSKLGDNNFMAEVKKVGVEDNK